MLSICLGSGNWQVLTSSSGSIDTLTGNTGEAISPTSGNINIVGTGGVSVAGAGDTLTISAGAAFTWSTQAAGTPLLAGEGFISTSGSAESFALPTASCPVGSLIELAQNGAGLVTITQAAGQSIGFGTAVTAVGVGGTVVSTAQGDAIKLICTVADTTFQVVTGVFGHWMVN